MTSISISQSMSAQQLERKSSSLKEDFEEELVLLDPIVLEEHSAAVTSLKWYFFRLIIISSFQTILINFKIKFFFLFLINLRFRCSLILPTLNFTVT